MLVLVVVALVLLACSGVAAFYYLQLKKKQPPQADEPDLSANPNLGTCARCQQRRIIVKKEAGLCAFCWSSINTKQSG
jgi:hypothetical protein